MGLKFYSPPENTPKMKCTIQQNGRLGFNMTAIDKLRLRSIKKYARFATDEDTLQDYIFIVEDKGSDTFNISRAGEYFYINTKALYDDRKIDYKNFRISYIMEKDTSHGEGVFKLLKNYYKPRKKEENINVEIGEE